jgi:glycosyltransferase involved in cell wall biosynthesis
MSVIALIPAYNAARTIEEVVGRCPAIVDEIAVVDDGSSDETYAIISSLGGRVTALKHPKNRGYGGAQKSLYEYAMTTSHDYFVNLCSDGGHLPEEIPDLVDAILESKRDVVLGSRTMGVMRDAQTLFGSKLFGACVGRGGMPGYIFTFHKVLSALQNFCYRSNYDSWHSGFRVIHRSVLDRMPYQALTEWYEYDTEFLIQMTENKISFTEIPVSVCYRDDVGSSVPVFKYGWRILRDATRYRLGGGKSHHEQKETIPARQSLPNL